MYYFQQKTPNGMRAALESYRAGHRGDRDYIFGLVPKEAGYVQEDANLSHAIIEAWTSFAKTG